MTKITPPHPPTDRVAETSYVRTTDGSWRLTIQLTDATSDGRDDNTERFASMTHSEARALYERLGADLAEIDVIEDHRGKQSITKYGRASARDYRAETAPEYAYAEPAPPDQPLPRRTDG